MPRVPVRRKASEKVVNKEDEVVPPKKTKRAPFSLPIPTRPRITGKVLVCGQGDMGQLGLGDDDTNLERKRLAVVDSIEDAVDVRAGGMHNLVLTEDGRILSFGCNDEGALGRDSSEDGSEFVPRVVELPGKVLRISAGDSHSACLLEDGRVFAWGSFRDSHGNMGLTVEGNKRLPIEVLPGERCCDVASGADHLVILTCAGNVFTVGCAEQGQLGRVSLRSASGEGRRGKVDLLSPGKVVVKRGKPIEKIWATNFCTFLQETETGTIWAFGLNNYSQLAYGKNPAPIVNPIKTTFVNVKEISGGQHHTLLLKEDGSCFVIGRCDYGRLGLGKITKDIVELQPINALNDKIIASVACGEAQSFAITEDGKLYSWGMGSNYQLGTGTDEDVLEPTLIVSKQIQHKRMIRASSGGQHSIFLVEDDMEEVIDQERPALTKKAAAAAKEREEKIATKSKSNDVQVNGEAETTEVLERVAENETENEAVELLKSSPKRGRKKK